MRAFQRILISAISLILASFFLACSHKEPINLDPFPLSSSISFKSDNDLDNLLSSFILDKDWVIQNFDDTAITAKDGEFWEGMDFNIYSLGRIVSKSFDILVIAKELQFLDGQRVEFYLIQIDKQKYIEQIELLGITGNDSHCDKHLEIDFNAKDGFIKYINSCYSHYDDLENLDIYDIKEHHTEFKFEEKLSMVKKTHSIDLKLP